MSDAYHPDAKLWYAKYHTLLADMQEIERITWREGNTMTKAMRALHDIRKIARAASANCETPQEEK